MEAIVAQIQSAQPGEEVVGVLKRHNDSIGRWRPNELIRVAEDVFPVQHNPVVYCFLLAKLIGDETKNPDRIAHVVNLFTVAKGNPHFYLIYDSVNILTNYMFQHIDQGKASILNALYNAVNLISGPNNDLTFTHQIFVQAAIQQKYYDLAYPIAKRPVYSVNAALFPEFKTKQIELYYYYAGIICAAVKDFSTACKLFKFGMIIPGGTFNAIQFDILKKYYVVSLIEFGKRPSLSALTPSRVLEYFRVNAGIYIQLANGVENMEIAKVEQLINEKKGELVSDANFGLAKQCIEAMKKTKFTRLVETFGSMKYSDLINRASINNKNDVVDTVLRVVESGEVQATINEAAETVEFGSTGGGLDAKEKKRALAVATQLQELGRLSNQLSVTNDRLLEEPVVVNLKKTKI